MVPERTLTLTNSDASTANSPEGAMKSKGATYQSSRLARLSHILAGSLALVGAMATAGNVGLVQLAEHQTQSLFFELRGGVASPDNIVILSIDNDSLEQGKNYLSYPQQYGYLEPLQQWPWKRAAYARVIQRLVSAGAKSVALDLVLDKPSRYGAADDRQLQQVLQRYAGKVTLAAVYEALETHQGSTQQLTQPHRLFWTTPMSVGSINYPLAPDGKIHQFASEYSQQLVQTLGKAGSNEFKRLSVATPSFDEATLSAAQLRYPKPKGNYIHFYGPRGTFEQIPFWYVLDPVNWNNYLQQGKYFKDKIVLIGPTATELKDFHRAPFSQSWLYPEPLSGVEIHANAIATLLQGKAIAQAIPNPLLRGLFVFVGVAGIGFLLSKPKRSLPKVGWTIGAIVAWGSLSYMAFIHGKLIVPTAVPLVAIAGVGVSYLTTTAANEQLKKRQLRQALERYTASPIVQEILSQQDDFQDLLPKRQQVAPTNRVLDGRYQIVKVLGAGGFGETYIAQDIKLPGNPLCVVKQLKPARTDIKHLQLAKRLFQREAEVLHKLGQHEQIPQLLAYFDECEEFYLVQEFIDGHPLDEELLIGKQLPEAAVINMLQELLHILEFVHQQGVIHRDIKPSNIIRRHADSKLVLIDFGAVKEVSTQLMNSDGQSRFTVGIGTQGYAPNEQCAGRPRLNSDVYAVGMIGIQALTGSPPSHLQQDVETGEAIWLPKAQVSPELADILTKMVRYDFRQRYQFASEARAALLALPNFEPNAFPPSARVTNLPDSDTNLPDSQPLDAPTAPWSSTSETIST